MFPCAVQYILSLIYFIWIFPVAQTVKNLLAMQEAWVQSPGWEDPLEKEMASHAGTLAWEIPWTEEFARPQTMGSTKDTTK